MLGEPGGVDDYQGFVIGMCSRWRPVEAAGDHSFVVDHGELVMQLVAAGEAGGANTFACSGCERIAQGCSGLLLVHKPEPKPEMHWIS